MQTEKINVKKDLMNRAKVIQVDFFQLTMGHLTSEIQKYLKDSIALLWINGFGLEYYLFKKWDILKAKVINALS